MFFDILPIYCVCLYELKKLGELYQCAHNLVENYPKRALSWFAVVSYKIISFSYFLKIRVFTTITLKSTKQLESTSKRLIFSIGIIPIVKWGSPTHLLSRMNQIRPWPCIEHAQGCSRDVITHIFTLVWSI